MEKVENKEVEKEVKKLVARCPVWGYRRVTSFLRCGGMLVNHKRVMRIMREIR